MNLNHVTLVIHDHVRKVSNLERFICDRTFVDFFNSVTDFHKEKILILIKDFRYDELKNYLSTIKERKIDSLCVRDLRFLASQCKVYRYSSLSKAELLKIIKEKTNGAN